MPNYVMVDNDFRYDISTTTKASGPQLHEIWVGALNGQTIYGYSGQVDGINTFYFVDLGANGRGISAT